MKLPLVPLLAVILSCSIGDATPLVYDTEGHELMSNSSYYILPVEEGGTGGGLKMSYEWKRCNFFVAQARGKAEDGVAVRITPPGASVYDPIFNPVAVHLSTDVTITFDVVTVCVESMYWHISDKSPLSTTSNPRQHVAVGKDEDADMPFPPSPDMLFSIERYDGAVKGYKLVSCNSTGPYENLGLHAFKGKNWLTTSASALVVVFKKGHRYA
ncbi:hypothetical protein C2845_PM12G21430 [Panicum miliaceum]|uniref:Uncharacterized protein n=1 Tax=Panicum miliaceum TaxID=4540 RepID=A0A3L6QG15_PANMI|nr:hypothetical protein C2845_PM12G21430 [Panicum miliaceum]